MAQVVKSLPAMQEAWVQSLDQEDPLEKEMATHSSILAWEIPRTEEPGGLRSMGSQSWTWLSTGLREVDPHASTKEFARCSGDQQSCVQQLRPGAAT